MGFIYYDIVEVFLSKNFQVVKFGNGLYCRKKEILVDLFCIAGINTHCLFTSKNSLERGHCLFSNVQSMHNKEEFLRLR